jgi:hypothetical protein
MSGTGTKEVSPGTEEVKALNTLRTIFALVTPARVTAVVAYAVSVAYPGVDPSLRAAIVGAVTGLYILCVTIVEVTERKHGGVVQSSRVPPASATRTQRVETTETKVIR